MIAAVKNRICMPRTRVTGRVSRFRRQRPGSLAGEADLKCDETDEHPDEMRGFSIVR